MTASRHPAPLVQPSGRAPTRQWANRLGCTRSGLPRDLWTDMESRGGWASGAIEFTRNGALASFQGGSRRMFIKMRDMTKTLAFAFDRWDVLEGGVFRVGDERLNLTKGGVAEPTWRHVDSSCLVGG